MGSLTWFYPCIPGISPMTTERCTRVQVTLALLAVFWKSTVQQKPLPEALSWTDFPMKEKNKKQKNTLKLSGGTQTHLHLQSWELEQKIFPAAVTFRNVIVNTESSFDCSVVCQSGPVNLWSQWSLNRNLKTWAHTFSYQNGSRTPCQVPLSGNQTSQWAFVPETLTHHAYTTCLHTMLVGW